MGIKAFFKKAFADMKESTKAQHEVDKAEFKAAKAEAKAEIEGYKNPADYREAQKAELEAAGYEVDLQYASNDIATQVSQIENMINSGCSMLVVASIDGDSLGTVLEMAKEGKGYKEILQYFFEGTEIKEVAEILWKIE